MAGPLLARLPATAARWHRPQPSPCRDGVELSSVRLTWPSHTLSLWKLFPPVDKARISRAASQEAHWLTPWVPRRLCPPALWAALEAVGPGALASGVTVFTQSQPTVIAGASPMAAWVLLEANFCRARNLDLMTSDLGQDRSFGLSHFPSR